MIPIKAYSILIFCGFMTIPVLAVEELSIDLSGLNDKQRTAIEHATPTKIVVSNPRYQMTESVSSTVYSSQSATNGLPNVEDTVESLTLSLPIINSSTTDDIKTVVVADEAQKPDVSMLAFIDEWLGIEPVKPWEKGTLAKKEMKPGGIVPEFDVFSEKVFAYKQGSVGGSGVGGGGCGCN
jgi:hypothetical protein